MEEREGRVFERRTRTVQAPADEVYAVFTGLGGRRGWPYADFLWRLRGAFDRLVGGVGMRRGRRHPDELRPGDALDFWRVESVEPGRSLRLRAEMKVPGRAWLVFEVAARRPRPVPPAADGGVRAAGAAGALYWYALYPAHKIVFSGMVEAIGRRAEAAAARAGTAARRKWREREPHPHLRRLRRRHAGAGPALARGDRPAALPADHRPAAAARSRTCSRRRSSTPSTWWA